MIVTRAQGPDLHIYHGELTAITDDVDAVAGLACSG